MVIDRTKLEALDDKTLGDMIYSAVRAMGFSEERARKMAQNAPAMRVMLTKASDRDLQRIVSFVGEKKAADILGAIEKKE